MSLHSWNVTIHIFSSLASIHKCLFSFSYFIKNVYADWLGLVPKTTSGEMIHKLITINLDKNCAWKKEIKQRYHQTVYLIFFISHPTLHCKCHWTQSSNQHSQADFYFPLSIRMCAFLFKYFILFYIILLWLCIYEVVYIHMVLATSLTEGSYCGV